MSHVTQVLSPEDILLDLEAATKKRVFEEVGRHFEKRHGISRMQVVESLIARERLGSTGLGQGVALPHARIKHLPQAMAAFVQLKLPIAFDSPDAKPVSDMLILLVPEHATEQHLQVLAEFAQMLGDRTCREAIRECADAAAVYHLFSAWPLS
jgi:PTS system nitrogen regulatory IIA component